LIGSELISSYKIALSRHKPTRGSGSQAATQLAMKIIEPKTPRFPKSYANSIFGHTMANLFRFDNWQVGQVWRAGRDLPEGWKYECLYRGIKHSPPCVKAS
jgi:hypothetical protein